MDKTKLNLERLRAYDAEWEEDKHPRAENGQFTSGSGSSAGGGAESGSKYGYSRSEQHVASKMEEWGNEQGNIAALEAADAFRDAREDENDMREVLKSVRQHLVENEDDIRGYDENPKNFDKVMEQLDDMESMLDDQDDYEFKHGEIKSPLRQAAETMQGKSTKATPEFGSEKFHFDVSNYKTVVSGKDANTPEGEVHNSIIGMLETDNPTKYDIANAAFYLADEDYNDKVRHCREMIRKAKAQGKSKASQEWGEALIKANKQVTLLNAIGEAMRK